MKRLTPVATMCSILVAMAPTFAQQSQNPPTSEPPYGYYHMWGGPWGWHAGMIFGPIMMLLVVVGIVALVVLLVRSFGYGHSPWYRHGGYPPVDLPYRRHALDILEERFAKGEINKEEFEEKRRLIGRS
jgi:putative membrane protein